MAVQVNKRSLFFLLLLAFVIFLVVRNLKETQKLATALERHKLGHRVPSEAATVANPFRPSTEEPLWLSPRTQELQELLKCRNRRLRLQKEQHGKYWVVQNLISGRLSRRMACAESITYTTNGDYTFFDNLETIADR